MDVFNEYINSTSLDEDAVVSIGSLIKRIREKGKNDETVKQVYVVSNSLGIVKAEEYRDNTIHSEDTSNYTIIRPGMIAYNPSRLNIGSIGMLKYDEPGLVSPMYVVFEIDEERITKEYFEYLMGSDYVLAKIESFKEEGARFRFDFGRWDWIKVPVPSIEIQTKIVDTLKKFRECIEGIEKEQENRTRQYYYYRDHLLDGFNQEALSNVVDICDDIFLGLTAKVDYVEEGGVPLVRANNMTSGTLDLSDIRCISHEQHEKLTKNHKPRKGDLLVSKSGTLGAVCIIDTDEEFSIYESLICLRPKEGVYNRYLLHLLRSTKIQDIMLEKKVGNAIKHLNLQTFRNLYVPLPSIEEQKKIAGILDVFEELCERPNCGLTAEIEARKKQFSYYQNRIIGFNKIK
ncbi:restriction endonuclease subunit S [Candidatus Merdisoma sp. HCP28S3_D10]|uniref:restriction endonuclease subunit S n=1 Tax=unclassified Candidatus Merdisoma TaxID=3099611 RepID=UPI003F8A2B31